MIIKSHEIDKINLNLNNFILLYGKNDGFKSEATNHLVKAKSQISNYDEKEVLDNENAISLPKYPVPRIKIFIFSLI